MDKNELSHHLISKALNDFEQQNIQLLCETELMGWNAWQIIKKPLYYRIKHYFFPPKHQYESKSVKVKLINYLFYFFRFCCIDLIVLLVQGKRNKPFILTNSICKLEKNDLGKLIDVFFDGLIISEAISNPVILEEGQKIHSKKLFQPADLRGEGLHLPTAIGIKLFTNSKEIKRISIELTSKLNRQFNKLNLPFEVRTKDIITILSQFKSSFHIYRFLFTLIKPNIVLFQDRIGSGAMAAAITNRLFTIEFQHGFINNQKPDYIIPVEFKKIKTKMITPNKICTFGDFFSDILLESEFWDKNEIESIGSLRMEIHRPKTTSINKKPLNKLKVLLASQFTIFSYCQSLLIFLAAEDLEDIQIYIKCHPREPKEHQEWYKNFCKSNPQNFHYIENTQSLVESMKTKDLLIGFHSTSLFEALGLGKRALTIRTEKYPKGIKNLINIDIDKLLIDADIESIPKILKQIKRKDLQEKINASSNYFFKNNYFDNLSKLIKEIESKIHPIQE